LKTIGSIFVCLMFLGTNLSSQTIHFTQAYAAHLTLNPANTGRFNGSWRATGILRDQGYQFATQYQTSYFSFEMPVYVKNERISTGVYYSHDNSGLSNLPIERIYGNIAASVPFSVKGSITAGLQIGYVHKQINWNNISFPEQYNRENGGFDPNLPNSEMFETDQTGWLDLGMGLVYSHKLRKALFIGGYSLQQINTPEESFLGISYDLPMRHVAHAKIDWDLNDRCFLMPMCVGMWQGTAYQMLWGVLFGVNLNEWMGQRNNLMVGLHSRNGVESELDALIVSAGFTYQFWSLTTSFDTDILGSKTGQVSGSAFELSLVFKLPATELTHKVVPCERY
jgi:type IX secretion system PorP/SprF family membrane protein